MTDRTLSDINRREIVFDGNYIREALPEYFASENANLITLFDKYYQNLDSAGNFGQKIKSLAKARDIGQTDVDNLTLIEDELLLGQNYLEGILDARTGAELSNNYYRTKGTKYGIQRFFRAFFNEDPDVQYGKDLMFIVGETEIGPESNKFIQNDKVYQFFGILIKVGLSQSQWIDLYKLFAHPAGMFVGSEVQIVSVNRDISFDIMPIKIDPDAIDPIYEGIGRFAAATFGEQYGLLVGDSDEVYRYDFRYLKIPDLLDSDYMINGTDVDSAQGSTYGKIEYGAVMHNAIVDIFKSTSETFDEDSSGDMNNLIGMRMSNTLTTMDADRIEVFDSAGSLPIDASNPETFTDSEGLIKFKV